MDTHSELRSAIALAIDGLVFAFARFGFRHILPIRASHESTRTMKDNMGNDNSIAVSARAALAVALISMTSACVTTGTYNKKIAELDQLRADHDRAAADNIAALTTERNSLRKKLDDQTALVKELSARLETLGENVGS